MAGLNAAIIIHGKTAKCLSLVEIKRSRIFKCAPVQTDGPVRQGDTPGL